MSRTSPPSTRALEQARARLEEQLAAHPEDPKLLLLLARATERLGRFEDAATLFQRGAKALRGAGDRPGEASALLESAQAYARGAQPPKARTFFQRAVAAYELLGDESATARARLAQARFLLETGAPLEARQQLERCVEPLERAGAWDDAGFVRERLCAILGEAGELEGALEHAKGAVRCAASAKDRSRFGERLSEVSRVHQRLGNLGKARSYQAKALPHLREAGQREALFAALRRLSDLALADDDPDDAERWATEAIELADAGADPGEQGSCRLRLAELLVRRRREDRARKVLEQAIERLHQAGDPRASAPAHHLFAIVLRRLGKRAQAAKALERAEDLFRTAGDEARAAEMAAARAEAASGGWRP